MRRRVLVSAPYMQPVLERFRPRLEAADIELVVPPVTERLSEAELLEWIGDIDGVIAGDDRFNETVLRAARRLKVISKWGTGIDSIDQVACARHGVAVCNTPDAFSQPVADSVLGYALCFARQLPWMDREMRAGRWHKRPGVALGETTLGVIGVGNVGKAVVWRAQAFGMRLLGTDIRAVPDSFLAETGIEMTSLDELLGAADMVSLNCDLNPTSHHIISDRALGLMRSHAVLINTARGPLIDETALVRALTAGQIGGVAMDVFEHEPLAHDHRLRAFDNVMLAPHNANSSPRAWERVHHSTIDNLLAELDRPLAKSA